MSGELPWDCAVPGVPPSLKSNSARRSDWHRRVGTAARALWPVEVPPLEVPLALLMAFFHSGQPIDVDNMLKRTVDGLKGITYDDDRRLEQVIGLRHDLSTGLRTEGLSPVLAGALVTALHGGAAFVYLRLTPPTAVEELLR